jgi:BCD family chlorophyll transporter-like MFS transporter
MNRDMTLSWLQIVRLGVVQMALGRDRRSDNFDAEPPDGGGTGAARGSSRPSRGAALRHPAVAPAMGLQVRHRRASHTLDHRRHGILALGGLSAAYGVVLMANSFALGMTVSDPRLCGHRCGRRRIGHLASGASGHGHGAAPPPAAATITWLMMIVGIAVTAGVSGQFLDPYTPERLMNVVAVVTALALVLTCLAVWGIERACDRPRRARKCPVPRRAEGGLGRAKARMFTIFVFLSMTAYFMQELILEPYSGLVFNFTPGQSTSLSGAQNGGVFLGMVSLSGIAGTALRIGTLRQWVIAGCIGSAARSSSSALWARSGRAAAGPAVV